MRSVYEMPMSSTCRRGIPIKHGREPPSATNSKTMHGFRTRGLCTILGCLCRDSLWRIAGKPRPSITWWKDYRLIDESYFFDAEDNLVKNVLEIEALTRDDLLSVIVCQSSNN